MPRPRTILFLQLLIWSVLLGICASSCSAQLRPAAVFVVAASPEPPNHGLQEILSQQLIRDRQIELLLRSAGSVRGIRDAERLRESLLPIFAHPHDLFELNSGDASAKSLRHRALTLLMQSSPELQQTWVVSNRVIAQQELETALLRGGRHAVALVARQFPLTESGIRAEVIDMTCDLLKGDARKAASRIRYLETLYAGTVLQKELERQLRAFKKLLSAYPALLETSESTRLSVATAESHGSIAPPWPEPLWTWRENIWNFPGTLQGSTGALFQDLDPEAVNRFEIFNNWQAAFWNNDIVIRTPFRIVALERSSGQELWSLPTDTFERQADTTYSNLADSPAETVQQALSLDSAFPIHGMAEFGLIAVDSDFMFFIDRFKFLSGRDPITDNQSGRVIRQRNGFPVIEEDSDSFQTAVASRLVAVRRSAAASLPVVAWQIGDGGAFQYKPVTKVEVHRSDPAASGSKAFDPKAIQPAAPGSPETAIEQTWLGHRFLSPPTGQGTRLFVLTQNETQVFLSCLQRNTGELLWRQPLAYTDENAVSFIDSSIFTKRTSVCTVSGELVVCSLADGMLIGVSAIDGMLKWATAIRDEPSAIPQFRFGRSFSQDGGTISSPSILVPWIANEIIVSCNHHSESVYALSLQTGEILWKTSRRAFGAGEVGGSPDYYVAGIYQNQVILIGDRHCRSLDLKTGSQNWVLEIHGNSGRAECSGDRCVIPMRRGQALTVNLASGTVVSPLIIDSPEDSMDQYGAVSSDDELICVATPTCIAVFPRVDVLLKQGREIPALTADPKKQAIVLAQAHLINGDFDAALALLKETVVSDSPDTSTDPQLAEFLAKLILEQWGEAIGARLESEQDSRAKGSSESVASIPQHAELLSGMKLPDELEFRKAVFELLSDTSFDRSHSPRLNELRQHRNWNLPLRLTSQWSVRADLLLDVNSTVPPMDSPSLDGLSIHELRQTAGHFLRHPETIPDTSARQLFVSQLLNRRDYAVAELFLIRWCEATQDIDPESAELASKLLTEMRSAPGPSPSSIADDDAGLTSAVTEPLTFELLPFIRQPDADFEATNRQLSADSLPKRFRMHTYLTGESTLSGDTDSAKLLTIDPMDNTVRDEVSLPFSIVRTAGRFVPLSDGDLTPSLFPVCGADEIAMISCPLPGHASVLWRRKFRSGQGEGRRVHFGSLGADHLIWQFADILHCSDPLTGQDLWTRKLTLSESDEFELRRSISPSIRRIAGDRQTTVITGSDSQSYARFQTRDGRRLDTGRLTINQPESALTVGRCLLYTDDAGQLRLFDGKTGNDKLAATTPVIPVCRDHRIIGRVLENSRLLVLAEGPESLELVMINVDQGTTLFRTPVTDHVRQGFLFSISAFERNGRLFVGLSGGGMPARPVQQALVRGTPHLANGPLLCLDPSTGDVRWSIYVDQAVFPEIHGDPTDLLVAWTAPKAIHDGNMGTRNEDQLMLQVFDETTGQLIAQSQSFSSLPPLRCVHISNEKLIQLTTPNATISIRASPVESVDVP